MNQRFWGWWCNVNFFETRPAGMGPLNTNALRVPGVGGNFVTNDDKCNVNNNEESLRDL